MHTEETKRPMTFSPRKGIGLDLMKNTNCRHRNAILSKVDILSEKNKVKETSTCSESALVLDVS